MIFEALLHLDQALHDSSGALSDLLEPFRERRAIVGTRRNVSQLQAR